MLTANSSIFTAKILVKILQAESEPFGCWYMYIYLFIHLFIVFWLQHNDVSDRFLPTNAKVVNSRKVNRRQAYDRAIEFISRNPQERFCQITHNFLNRYTLKRLESSAKERPMFRSDKKDHVLFFSEKYFIWKEDLPGR